MAFAWLVVREYVDRRLFIGAMAILAGAVLLSWQAGTVSISWGALLIIGACLAWAIDNNLTRKVSGSDPIQIVAIKGIVAGAINLGLGLAQGVTLPAWPLVAGAAFVGLLGYGISLVFFVMGLRHLGSARTGAYFSTAPFIGAIIAIPMFGEQLTLKLAGAALLMGIGVYMHVMERHDHEHMHEAINHEHHHVHDEHHQHNHGPNDPPGESHSHWHHHAPMRHSHPHYPDMHHRHSH